MGFLDRFRASRPAPAPGQAGQDGAELEQASRQVDQGNDLFDQGRLDEALARYAEAIRLAPALPRAHLNLGNLLLARRDAQGALDAYATALAHDPGYAAAHFNMGHAHARMGRLPAALASYERALQLKPDFAEAAMAMGTAQDDLQRLDEALDSYRRALLIRPDYAQVHYNMANVLQKLGRLEQAAQSCRRALEADPGFAEAHYVLGLVLQDQGKWLEALQCYRRARAERPHNGAAATQAYHCANYLCDWSSRKQDEQALAGLIAGGGRAILPFPLLSLNLPGEEAALLQRRAGLQFAQDTLGVYLAGPPLVDRRERPPGQRLRIGYLSADFHEHATMHLLRGVLAGHDASRFSIAAYSYGPTHDGVTQQVRQCCDIFRDLRKMDDAQAAAAIAADGVDILVDLKGFTQHTRMAIPAQRPAPVIVSWLGYPGTLGHERLADYLVGDPVVTPPEHAGHFSETLALMPHCYQPNDRNRVIGARPSRAQAGLPPSGFVFCSFNQSYKFNPETFDVWCRLLSQVPGSVLWLLGVSEPIVRNLRREAALRGVAANRLVFSPPLALAEHLGRLQLADLALDTFPYNSHTTGSDALWTGVPLVTRTGATFASRVAASLLHAAGVPELVTADWAGYFDLALGLARDPDRLAAIRNQLAAARPAAPLFDTPRFTRNLERLYERIWQQHAAGKREPIILQDAGAAGPAVGA